MTAHIIAGMVHNKLYQVKHTKQTIVSTMDSIKRQLVTGIGAGMYTNGKGCCIIITDSDVCY